MLALQIRCVTYKVVVKCLRSYLKGEVDQLKKYKEGVCTFKGEVTRLTNQVKRLDGASCWVEELTEANSIQIAEMASLRESVEKAKVDSVNEFKDSQPFFDLLGSQYGEGFEDFWKQTVVLFLDLDFSSV